MNHDILTLAADAIERQTTPERKQPEENVSSYRPLRTAGFSGPAAKTLWGKLCAELGLDSKQKAQRIGSGQDGTAYDVGTKVLKITRDEPEAQAMNRLFTLGGDPNHFVKVQGVVELVEDAIGLVRWAILMERLDQPNEDWKNYATLVNDMLVSGINEGLGGDGQVRGDIPLTAASAQQIGSWIDVAQTRGVVVLDANTKQVIDEPVRAGDGTFGPDRVEFYGLDVGDHLAKNKWLVGVGQELDRMDIRFWDIHAGNVMRRGAQHVMIDLGRSLSDAAQLQRIEAAYLRRTRQR